MMKKVIIALMAILASGGVKAQQIDVYCNDNPKPEVSFLNTETKKYKVVFREEEGTYNGHQYVEIGGLKWATMNIGATTVAESAVTAYGDYYAWGELDTYYSEKTAAYFAWDKTSDLTYIKGKKTGYNSENYYGDVHKEWSPVPYDENYCIKPEYDVAKATWGGKWRMPRKTDFELLNKACGISYNSSAKTPTETITEGGLYWVNSGQTIDGQKYKVEGALFVSVADPTQRLFLPAAGMLSEMSYFRPSMNTVNVWIGELDNGPVIETSIRGIGLDYCIVSKTLRIPSAASRTWGVPVRPVAD